jgi:hypothetical protein
MVQTYDEKGGRVAGATWDERSFFGEAESREPRLTSSELQALRDLYGFFKGQKLMQPPPVSSPYWKVRFGSGKEYGSFLPTYQPLNPTSAVLYVYTDGGLYINFDRFPAKDERMTRLAEELRKAPMDPALHKKLANRSPGFTPDQWAPRRKEIQDAFVAAFPGTETVARGGAHPG